MIDILLATYNGEKYIDTQISSIVNQTYKNWKLYIHDDGSNDSSVEKINHWCELDSRIQFVDDKITFHNPALNFMHLLKFSTSDFICFADQDDLWLEYKLQEMIDNFVDSKNPSLLVSSCYLWNTEQKEIYQKMNFNPAFNLEQFLFLNGGLQGCAMMFNAELRKIVLSKEIENLYMHDYLISIAAFTFGDVRYLNKNLFLYRQYENNVSVHLEKNKSEHAKQILKNKSVPVVYKPVYQNIQSFYESFENQIPKNKKKIFTDYLALKDKTSFKRILSVLFSKFSLGKKGKIKLLIKIICRPFWRDDYE